MSPRHERMLLIFGVGFVSLLIFGDWTLYPKGRSPNSSAGRRQHGENLPAASRALHPSAPLRSALSSPNEIQPWVIVFGREFWRKRAPSDLLLTTQHAPLIVARGKIGDSIERLMHAFESYGGPDAGAFHASAANLSTHPRIFVCLPVPAYGINFDINPDIIKNEIIPIIKQVAKQKGATTVDLYTALSGRPDLFQTSFIRTPPVLP